MINRTLLALSLICLVGCKKAAPPPTAPAPPSTTPAAADSQAGAPGPADEEVRPVYSEVPGAPDPLAQKLCTALHALAEERRAACCKITPGVTMVDECVKIVSAALRSKAVTVDPEKVQRCTEAMDQALTGCGWAGPWGVGVPAECSKLFAGHRPGGELCRSSLECQSGLSCRAVGPTAAGRCDKPLPTGERCAVSVDVLAVYARQEVDLDHPECSGFCGHLRCFDKVAEAGKCASANDCAAGLHCTGSVCKSGLRSALGQGCVGGGCAEGLRCIASICAQPRDQGSCAEDQECRGGCLKKPGAAEGVCGMRCDLR